MWPSFSGAWPQKYAENPAAWRGQNLLGFALMEVRDELRRVCANEDRIDWNL